MLQHLFHSRQQSSFHLLIINLVELFQVIALECFAFKVEGKGFESQKNNLLFCISFSRCLKSFYIIWFEKKILAFLLWLFFVFAIDR